MLCLQHASLPAVLSDGRVDSAAAGGPPAAALSVLPRLHKGPSRVLHTSGPLSHQIVVLFFVKLSFLFPAVSPVTCAQEACKKYILVIEGHVNRATQIRLYMSSVWIAAR